MSLTGNVFFLVGKYRQSFQLSNTVFRKQIILQRNQYLYTQRQSQVSVADKLENIPLKKFILSTHSLMEEKKQSITIFTTDQPIILIIVINEVTSRQSTPHVLRSNGKY